MKINPCWPFGLLLILCFVGCKKTDTLKDGSILAAVNGQILHKSDLAEILPKGLNAADSAAFAIGYINQWVKDILVLEKAESNLSDIDEISKQVLTYRNLLIVHHYQQQLFNEKLSKEIATDELKAYYDQNQGIFLVENPLIKGIFLRLPLNAPGLNEVKVWFKSKSDEAIEKIEKYTLQNGISYDYFYDKWTPMEEIAAKLPKKIGDLNAFVQTQTSYQTEDSTHIYLLNISEYRAIGKEEPFEFAVPKIKEVLLNQKRMEFITKMERDLLEEAKSKNRIKYD